MRDVGTISDDIHGFGARSAQERSPILCLHEHEQQAMQDFQQNYRFQIPDPILSTKEIHDAGRDATDRKTMRAILNPKYTVDDGRGNTDKSGPNCYYEIEGVLCGTSTVNLS